MKTVLVVLFFISTANASNTCPHEDDNGHSLPASQCCPIETGETRGTACANEQFELDQLMKQFKPRKTWWYQNDSVLRGPQVFKDKLGYSTNIIFNDIFIKNSKVVDHYFILQTNGKYKVYRDRTSDKVINIDTFLPTDVDSTVTFDTEGRPSFTLQFVSSDTGELLPPWTLYHQQQRAFFVDENGVEGTEYPAIGEYIYSN